MNRATDVATIKPPALASVSALAAVVGLLTGCASPANHTGSAPASRPRDVRSTATPTPATPATSDASTAPVVTAPVITAPVITTPNGTKLVAYHGISISVPTSFDVNPPGCFGPTNNSVSPDTGESFSCPMAVGGPTEGQNPPRFTTVGLSADDGLRTAPALPLRPVVINGLHGVEGIGTIGGISRTIVELPKPGVRISIAAPTDADAVSIVDTLQLTPIDSLGCRDHVDSAAAVGNPTAPNLIPGHPATGSICEYIPGSDGKGPYWLAGSRALAAAALASLTSAVDSLPVHAQSTTNAPGGRPFLLLQLHYRDGTSRVLEAGVDASPQVITDGHHVVVPGRSELIPDAFSSGE